MQIHLQQILHKVKGLHVSYMAEFTPTPHLYRCLCLRLALYGYKKEIPTDRLVFSLSKLCTRCDERLRITARLFHLLFSWNTEGLPHAVQRPIRCPLVLPVPLRGTASACRRRFCVFP